MRKLRVIYSDPDATDASSDEEDPKTANESPVPAAKRFVRLVDLPDVTVPQKKYGRKQRAVDRIVTGGEIIPPEKQRRQGNRIFKSPYVGVRQRAAGTWASEIRNPFTKTRIWLGTFASAEEARAAYLAKRLEFEAEERAMGISNTVVVGSPSSVLESGCSVSPVEGSSDSSSSGSKRFSDADSGGRDLDLKLETGSGVIDNNGFLLGEFSSLDDLRICKMEED